MLALIALAAMLEGGLRISGAAESTPATRTTVLLLVGAPGQPDYGSNFLHQASLWEDACTRGDCQRRTIGLDPAGLTNDFDQLRLVLEDEPKEGPAPLWLVLIGHGTFDGKEARFNLRGPDVSASDLAQWLMPFKRPLAVLNSTSCSAPFLAKLSATNRVIITATRSGAEQNFTRFGQYLAEAVTDPEADLDKDGQVSLLEGFLTASRRTAEFYKNEGRLATEHALLDDNGDGLGTPADWFRGLRATKQAKEGAALDGALAQSFHLVPSAEERALAPEQRTRRDALEQTIAQLRETKSQLPEDAYYQKLEKLLIELAAVYGLQK